MLIFLHLMTKCRIPTYLKSLLTTIYNAIHCWKVWITFEVHNGLFWFKWRIFSQPSKIGTGKNTKSLFFLLGLKYTLRTCLELKNLKTTRIWIEVASSFWKLLTNLAGWKLAYLVSQLRTGIWRKPFRLKACPQGFPVGKIKILYFYQTLFCLPGWKLAT